MHPLKRYQGSLGVPKLDYETHYLTSDKKKIVFVSTIKDSLFYKHLNFKFQNWTLFSIICFNDYTFIQLESAVM